MGDIAWIFAELKDKNIFKIQNMGNCLSNLMLWVLVRIASSRQF